MIEEILVHVVKLKSMTKRPFEIKIGGSSMLPIILPSDTAVVLKNKEYAIGDILLFLYESNHIIIHRLLKIMNGKYYCKGDNSFRLEIVNYSDILGKVILVKRGNIIMNPPTIPRIYLDMSYSINNEFVKNEFDIQRTQNTTEYIKYKKEYLDGYLDS